MCTANIAWKKLFLSTAMWLWALIGISAGAWSQAEPDSNSLVTLVPVEFPLSPNGEARLLETLNKLGNRSRGGERPIVVLEFTRSPSQAKSDEPIGLGTSFERALGLARWLSGPKGSRIRSIAFLPESITGHSVLVAMGCEEIAMAAAAELGRAGIDEAELDNTVRQAYLDVAARRAAFPEAAVQSLIDANESLVRLDMLDNRVEYTTVTQLAKRLRPEKAWNETQLVPTNQMAVFVGQELRTWRWIAHIANDRTQLAVALKLTKPITEQPIFEGPRTALRVHLKGIVSNRQVNRIIRALEEGLESKAVNLIMIEVDSSGGNLSHSLRLAQFLAAIPSDRAEVVSFVRGSALGDASLIPLASDTIMMHPDAKLGGAGEATISPETCLENKTVLQEFAKTAGRSDGEVVGCLCPDVSVFEYSSFDGRKVLSNPQWLVDDPALPQWHQGGQVSFRGGLNFDKAQEMGLARDKPDSIEAVGVLYGIDQLPDEARTNATERTVEWLASQGWLSMALFMVGIICLSAELSSPGFGIAGMMSGICFLLFFWIHLFQGTVEWLEILLIVAGVLCLAIEMFVLPGFGIFGVTGLILLAIGLLLAGQTFVWPTNEYQWNKMVMGIGQLGLIVLSIFVLAFVFRKQLANLPMVRWISLQPPKEDKELIAREQAVEELRAFIGWHGTTVSRCNPSGKATIGDRIFGVASQDTWIDENTDVEVVGFQGNTLIVKQSHRATGKIAT
ncbi:MAG: NfeD family protein [Pirellula sp.]